LNIQISKNDPIISSLIDLGISGHFPLFHHSWIDEIKLEKRFRLTMMEKKLANEILKRLTKHKSLERKQIILFSLPEEQRKTFIKAFIKLVEIKILDKRPEIH